MYKLKPERIAAPAGTPVTLAEAKANSRIQTSVEDDLVTGLIEAATAHLDGWSGVLGRCLITQTWRERFPCFPAGQRLRLGLAPVQQITTLTYWDGGVQEPFESNSYRLQEDALGAYIELDADAAWPGSDDRDDAVQVTYQAGYGTAASVPQPLKQAILLLVGAWYENREQTVIGVSVASLPRPAAVDSLIEPFRRVGV